MQLTKNFTLVEFIRSNKATELGIDNTPPEDVLEALKHTAKILQVIRDALGHPITISSGYRSPALNKAVGGAKLSSHLSGEAVDFVCPKAGHPLEVAKRIQALDLPFDQLIHEYGRWVHLGVKAKVSDNRRQLLTIDKQGTRAGLYEIR